MTAELWRLNMAAALLRGVRCQECERARPWLWYRREHAMLARLADATGRDLDVTCTVHALLSANTSIEHNRDLTARWAHGRPWGHFADIEQRIGMAEAGNIAGALRFGRGDRGKLTSFAHNLRRPRANGVATIDRHMWRIAREGDSTPSDDTVRYRWPWDRGYGTLEAIITTEAEPWDLRTLEAQALTWCHRVYCEQRRWERT